METEVYYPVICHTFETEDLKIANLPGLNGDGIIRKYTVHILSHINTLERKTVDR